VTLVELMAVVAIVGILAALALVGYRRYLDTAKTGETKDLVIHIASAQHSYYLETRGYLGCSTSYTDFYPKKPNRSKRHFHDQGHPDYGCWRLFKVDSDAATYSGFAVMAGAPGSQFEQPPTEQKIGAIAPVDKPWFVVYAASDLDDDGVMEQMYTSSLQPGDVHIENQGE
jgi:type IV pilus assembly protein PilA